MSDIVFKFISDTSAFTGGVASADAAVKKLNKEIAETEQVSKEAADAAVNGGKRQGDQFDNVTKKTVSLKAQLRQLKAELANATNPKDVERLAKAAGALEDQIGDAGDAAKVFATDSPFEAVGNAIGSIGGKLRNLDFKGAADQSKLLVAAASQITFKESLAGVKALGTTLANVGVALLSNPIFLIGAVIAGVAYATYDLITTFQRFAETSKVVSDSLKESQKSIENLAKSQLDYLIRLKTAQGELTKEQGERVKTELKYDQENLANKRKFSEKVLELAKDLGLDLGQTDAEFEREYQSKRKTASVAQLAIVEFNYQKELAKRQSFQRQLKILEQQFLTEGIVLNQNKVAEKAALIQEQENEAAKKLQAERDKANEAYKRRQEEFKQALLDLEKRARQKELEGLTGVERLEMQRKIANEEIKLLEETLIKKSIAAGKGNKLGEEQERQLAVLRTQINKEYNDGVFKLAVEEANKEAEFKKSQLGTEVQFLELKNTIAKNNIEKTKAADGSSALEKQQFEQQKNKSLLELELKFQEEKLALVIAQIEAEANVKRIALENELKGLEGDNSPIAQQRKAQIQQQVKSVEEGAVLATEAARSSFGKVKSETESQINELDKLITASSNKIDWQTALGLSDEDVAAIKSNFPILLSEAQKFMESYLKFQEEALSKELDANEKRQELLDKDIEGLEKKLEAETAFQSEGLANRVLSIQKELEEKKKAKEKELEDEKKLKLEQQKLARERLQLQQIQQAASLTTAIANIFASTSTAGPVGVAVGYVTIAAMLAAFAYSQGQASAAVNKEDNSFAKGVVDLKGKGTETSDEIPSNLSRGESVITAKGTKKSRTLLKGLNANDNKTIEKGIYELLKNTGVSLSNIPNEINTTRYAIREAEYNMSIKPNNSGVEKRLDLLTDKFQKSINSEKRTVLSDGRIMIKKGTLTTYIRPK